MRNPNNQYEDDGSLQVEVNTVAPQTGRGNTKSCLYPPPPPPPPSRQLGERGAFPQLHVAADRSSCLLFTLCHYVSRRPFTFSSTTHACFYVSCDWDNTGTKAAQLSSSGGFFCLLGEDDQSCGPEHQFCRYSNSNGRFLTIYFITVHTESGRMCVIGGVWDLTCLS